MNNLNLITYTSLAYLIILAFLPVRIIKNA